MSTIPLDYDEPGRVLPFRTPEPDDFAPPSVLTRQAEIRRIIESSPAHARAVAEGRSKRIVEPEPSDAPSAAVALPLTPFKPDVSGNPREMACTDSRRREIAQAQDEMWAEEARATVRPRGDAA